MRHVKNFLWFVLGFLLISAAMMQFAHAESPITGYRVAQYTNGPARITREGACADWAIYKNGTVSPRGTGVNYDGTWTITATQQCRLVAQPGAWTYDFAFENRNVCSNDTQPDTTKPLDQQCGTVCPAEGTSGPDFEVVLNWATSSKPDSPTVYKTEPDVFNSTFASSENPSCAIEADHVLNCWYDQNKSPNGYYKVTCDYSSKYTGNEASPSDQSPSSLNASQPSVPSVGEGRCPPGTVQTGYGSNGVPICAGNPPTSEPTNTTKQPTQTTQNPDGSTTQNDVSTRTNADGSTTTTTTTTTTNADGSQSTSTSKTTSNAANGAQGKDDGEGDMAGFCKTNPNLTICKNSSATMSCDNITCEGDAIQCAIFRQQMQQYCENKTENALSQAGQAIIDGNDPLAASLPSPTNAETINVASSLDQSAFLSSSCFQDKTFSVQGHQVTIPFSKTCDYLLPLRYAIMVIAGLAALKTISKPVLG